MSALLLEAALWGDVAMALLPWLVLITVLLGFSAFFSGSESAFFSLNQFALQTLEQEGPSGRAVGTLLGQPRKLLATLLLGNEVVNVAVSAIGVRLVHLLNEHGVTVPWWANILAITPLLLMFGEIAPKAIAVRLGANWARAVALPLTAFGYVVAPLRSLIHGVADVLLWGMGKGPDPLAEALHEAQLRALVDLSERQGVLDADEAELIHRVVDLEQEPVSRLMTPRPDVVAVPLTATLEQILEEVRASGYSRLPVYAGEPDQVRGVLVVKDLLPFRFGDETLTPRKLEALLKPPFIVPPGKPAGELMQEFRTERSHMALVFDEFGATLLGVVTMQDLLGELFEDLDEGIGRPAPGIERIAESVYRVPAKLPIDDWNRSLSPALPEGDSYTTVAGYIFHLFGHLPKKGEQVHGSGWVFQVTGLDGTRLTWITARRLPGATGRFPPVRERSP